MASYKVLLTQDAEVDLEEIYDYLAEHESPQQADYVLDALLKTTNTVTSFPEKGSIPKALQILGVRAYRQTFFKPYRVIYRVTAKQVVIFVITDGRSDMQTLLTRRLLGK